MPRSFSFELVEIWMSGSVWAPEGFIGGDREDARPKKEYSSLAGGYYAARLAVLEHLSARGRAAAASGAGDLGSLLGTAGSLGGQGGGQSSHVLAPMRFGTLGEALAEMERRLKTPAGSGARRPRSLAGPVQRSLMEF